MPIQEIVTSRPYKLKNVRCDKKDIKNILDSLGRAEIKYDSFILGNYTINKPEEMDGLEIDSCTSFRVKGNFDENKDFLEEDDIEINFSKDNCYIRIGNYNDMRLIGLVNTIKENLKGKFVRVHPGLLIPVVIIISVGVAVMIASLFSEPGDKVTPTGLVVLFAYFILFAILVIRYDSYGKVPLIMIKKKLSDSFFKRNRDSILINLFFLILGIILGALVTRYF